MATFEAFFVKSKSFLLLTKKNTKKGFEVIQCL